MPIADYRNVDVLARQGQEFGAKQQQSFLVQGMLQARGSLLDFLQ